MFRSVARWILVLGAWVALLGALAVPLTAAAQGNSEAAHLCQDGGYADYTTEIGGDPFRNTGECVRWAAQGGDLVPVSVPTATLTFDAACHAVLSVTGYAQDTYNVVFDPTDDFVFALIVGAGGTGSVATVAPPANVGYNLWDAPVDAYIDGTLVASATPPC